MLNNSVKYYRLEHLYVNCENTHTQHTIYLHNSIHNITSPGDFSSAGLKEDKQKVLSFFKLTAHFWYIRM